MSFSNLIFSLTFFNLKPEVIYEKLNLKSNYLTLIIDNGMVALCLDFS